MWVSWDHPHGHSWRSGSTRLHGVCGSLPGASFESAVRAASRCVAGPWTGSLSQPSACARCRTGDDDLRRGYGQRWTTWHTDLRRRCQHLGARPPCVGCPGTCGCEPWHRAEPHKSHHTARGEPSHSTSTQHEHTTHSTQHTAHSTQHTTHNTQHTTHSTQHTAHNTQHTTQHNTTQHNTTNVFLV